MRAVAHEFLDAPTPHASLPGESSWATDSRRSVRPTVVPTEGGFAPEDPYVRRYWVAAIGAGAVEDLLRLVAAARRSVTIPEPVFLATLLTEGLAHAAGDRVMVPDPIPALGPRARNRLGPELRTEHAQVLLARQPACDRSSTR